MRFIHIADVHLGNQQYNLAERLNDFARAFWSLVDYAIEQEVDACVIAGDLFHKASIDPVTLLQAEDGLRKLQAHGIPAVGVHGNHDKARHLAQISWLEYLAAQGLLYLLTPDFSEEPLKLVPWNDAENVRDGSYLDVDHVRFVGVPWLGASAPGILAEVAAALDQLPTDGIACTVLVTHAGIEGQMPNMPGGLSMQQLRPLDSKVEYLALGHLHKPYSAGGWIYNPGSLETCSFDERQYDRGAYLVEVAPDGTLDAQHVQTPMRPFFSTDFKTDLYDTPAELLAGVQAHVRNWRQQMARELKHSLHADHGLPVVRLVLTGNLTFDRTGLDMEAIRQIVRDEIDALTSRVENRTTPLGLDVVVDESLTRAQLEQTVFDNLARADSRYSRHADRWRDVMAHIKTMALEGEDPAAIFDTLDAQMNELEEDGYVDH